MKTVTTMDGNIGRKKRFSVLAFTGNQQGLAGFAIGKNPDGRAALKRAKNRAGQKLVFIDRYKEHTVLHDFFCAFGQTKVYVYKKPEGFGLVCHRVIRSMCQVIGIKDIYAKIEGAICVQNLVRAFMLGLVRQKSYHQIAEDKKLFLVEQREENENLPVVLAVPSTCRTEDEIPTDESLDFRQYGFDGRIVLKRRKFTPFYTKLPSWQNHLKKMDWQRNFNKVRARLYLEHGGFKSHLTAQHSECNTDYGWQLRSKRLREASEQEN